MKICIVAGTRPEIIKIAPLLDNLEKRGIDYFVAHTGQHYSYSLFGKIFEDLGISLPKYNLNIKSSSPILQGEHTGRIMIDLEKILLKEMPDIVMVHGDTNSTLAGALCTKKLETTNFPIHLHHIEAGLRSFDRKMPEEINRVITDHMSDVLFAPTELSKNNMVKEGISGKMLVTGNTIAELVERQKEEVSKSVILEKLNLQKNNYFLLTIHRLESVDLEENFRNIISGIEKIIKEHKTEVVFSIHPRSLKRFEEYKIKVPDGLRIIDAQGVNDFMCLEKNAKLILTDSGGVQEEACCMKVPCVTIRNNTERPETITVGANLLSGFKPASIQEAANRMLSAKRTWEQPFGMEASKKMINFIKDEYG